MAYVSTIISGAASLGVLIGLISGIFFLVLTALKWVSRVRASLYEEELHRHKFLINNPYLIGATSTDFIESRKTSNGLGSTLSGSNISGKTDEKIQRHEAIAEDWSQQPEGEKVTDKQETNADTVQVREFIEKMVETLIGGPLDGTTVGQLSTHSAYENGPRIDSSNITQTNLKRLIKRIVAEAMALPNIKEILCRPKVTKEPVNEDFKNKSYEDILATAILNKVIDHFQNNNDKENDTTDGYLKRRGGSRKIRRNEDDEELKSNSDWSDTSRSDQLSLTIEEYIEEVTTAFELSEDEKCELSDYETHTNRRIPFPESGRTVVDGSEEENSDLEEHSSATELITSTNSWEENWLFQKKRLRSTPNAHHPVPVPMLVPNPSEDFRALVGGVDADDLSDMSDCSDSALEELITKDEEPVLTSSKNEYQELSHHSSGEEVDEEKKEATKPQNVETLYENNNTEESLERERKEDEATHADVSEVEDECTTEGVTEEIKTTSLSITSPEVQKDREFSIEDFDFSHPYQSMNQTSSEGTEPATSISHDENTIRCRIAEREKEKWNNPVPLPDNPYSLENIEKREQKNKMEYFRIGTFTGDYIDFPDDITPDELAKRRSENLRFTRDYYVNASKHPSGMLSSSSSSLNHLPEAHEQGEVRDPNPVVLIMQNKVNEVPDVQPRSRVIKRSEFSLPNVKELAKHFTGDTAKETKPPNSDSVTKLESKHDTKNQSLEPETDWSRILISEIINNLQKSVKPPDEKPIPPIICIEKQPATRMKICFKTYSNSQIENCADKFTKNADAVEAVRFNGKQVHSLTARSISREFREGLKNHSCQRGYAKVDRSSSGAESDQGDVVSNNGKTSPTPSIDLKNMKKFWEEIITANANSTKEK